MTDLLRPAGMVDQQRHEHDGVDVSRMIDLKGIAKLPEFDGTDAEWPDWKFRFEALIGLMGLSDIMR